MTLDIEKIDNGTRIAVKGRLDTVTSQEFDSQVKNLGCDLGDVVLDCAEMEYISSAGLRSFITLLKGVKASGKDLRVVNVIPAVRPVFDMTGFSKLFNLD